MYLSIYLSIPILSFVSTFKPVFFSSASRYTSIIITLTFAIYPLTNPHPHHPIKVLLMPVAFLLGVGIYAPCSLYSVIAEDTAPAHLAPIATSLVASSSSG